MRALRWHGWHVMVAGSRFEVVARAPGKSEHVVILNALKLHRAVLDNVCGLVSDRFAVPGRCFQTRTTNSMSPTET